MEIITKTFKKLLASRTIDEVDKILDDLTIDVKYRMDETIYPRLKFKITRHQIEDLKEKGLITSDNLLAETTEAEPLTKLLYSVVWKNGDLKKVKHIIDGIISAQEDEKENGLVFYQFGKYLTKEPGEPIIDQHVLRAFGLFKSKGDALRVEKLKRLTLITKQEKGLIDQYKLWLRTELKKELRDCENYSYHVDKVLFAVGKSVKERN